MDRSLCAEDAFAYLFRPDADRRRMSAAAAFAALAHVGLFLIVWPREPVVVEPPPPERSHYHLTQTRVRRPPPPPPERPTETQRAPRRIPMPAPPPTLSVAVEPIALPPTIEPVALSATAVMIPAPPVPAPPPPAPQVVRVGGAIPRPERIVFVEPRYTEIARRARRGGTVILDTVIAEDGAVTAVTALKSLPFGLTEAAIAAVQQWRYSPTLVGGRAVPVRMTVTVRFDVR